MAKPDLSVVIGASTGQFDAAMASVDRRIRSTGDGADSLSVRMAGLGMKIATVTTAAVAAAAALGGIARQVTGAALELRNLSDLAGVSAERFQSLSYAASQVGIEEEKLADILKDVNDKFGDFLQTGAGPMRDFFEQIAPKVGVTAEQFRRLNAADALQLYVDSLEKANLSQADMTFYMEALANDATRLLPLMRDNGVAMRDLEQAARDLGIVIGEDLINRTARMEQVWSTMVQSMQAKFTTFASNVLVGLDSIFGITEEGQAQIIRGRMDALASDRQRTLEDLRAIDSGDAAGPRRRGTTRTALEQQLDQIEADMNRENDALRQIGDSLERRKELEKRMRDATQPLPESPGMPAPASSGGGGRSGGGAAPRPAEPIEEVAEAYDEAARAAESAEDAAVNFLMSLEGGAKNARAALAQLAAEMARLLFRSAATEAVGASGLGSFVEGIASAGMGGRAGGGSVRAGRPYLVNENTPRSEIFVPSTDGAILNVGQAQAALGGGGGMVASGPQRVVVALQLNDGMLDARIEERSSAVAVAVTRAGIEGYGAAAHPARQRQVARDPRRMG